MVSKGVENATKSALHVSQTSSTSLGVSPIAFHMWYDFGSRDHPMHKDVNPNSEARRYSFSQTGRGRGPQHNPTERSHSPNNI